MLQESERDSESGSKWFMKTKRISEMSLFKSSILFNFTQCFVISSSKDLL
jgi:hypothetical protein